MKRAVVTGASGFLGRHWTRFLEAKGVEVHAFTRKAQGPRAHAPDPMDPASLAAALRAAAPDRIFHLAGVMRTADVTEYYRVNLLYAVNLVAAAEAAGLADRPLAFLGSAAEYGPVGPEGLPVVETAACNPRSHYGASKYAQTLMAQASARAGRSVLIVRPSNIVGPGMPRWLVLQDFVEQLALARRGETMKITVSDPTVVRDFIDVADVCERLWLLSEAGIVGEIVNVSTGRGVALGALLERLVAVSKVHVEVAVDRSRGQPDEVPAHVSSPAKLERLVHPPPLTPLDETLRRVLAERAGP